MLMPSAPESVEKLFSAITPFPVLTLLMLMLPAYEVQGDVIFTAPVLAGLIDDEDVSALTLISLTAYISAVLALPKTIKLKAVFPLASISRLIELPE